MISAVEDGSVVYVMVLVISASVVTDVHLATFFMPSVSNPAKKYLDMNNVA